MEFKRPENFEDMLKLQKHLDENLNNVRPRTLRDIVLSLIAEYIEFNEETPESHKTWKTKTYDKQKEIEEIKKQQIVQIELQNMETTKKEKYYDTTIRFINAPLSFLIMLKKEADRLGIETEKISSKQI